MTCEPMHQDVDPAALIRLSEAAVQLGVHPQTLRRWIQQGKLTGWRLASNQIRVDRNELAALATPMTTTSGNATVVELRSREVGA